MPDDGEDIASAPPRPTPPRPKRESMVLDGDANRSDPKPLPPRPEPPRSSAGLIAAGAVGGVIGAVAIIAGLWLFDTAPAPASLAKRLDALEAQQSSAQVENKTALETGAVERKALSERLAALEVASKPEVIAALSGKVSALEAAASADAALQKSFADDLAQLKNVPPPADNHDLEQRLAALESLLKPETLVTLSGRLSAVEAAQTAAAAAQKSLADDLAQVKNAPPPTPNPDLEKRLAALETNATPTDAPPPANDPRVANLVADEKTLADGMTKQSAVAAALAVRLQKLEAAVFAVKAATRVAPTEPAPAADAPAPPTIRAVAALSLRDRVRAGEPYVGELSALEAAGVDPAALAPLKPFAEAGVYTTASLARSFKDIAPKLRAAPQPAQPGGAVLDRFVGEVQGLVRVRKAADNAAPAPAPDAEAALAADDLPGAVAALKNLPAPALALAADWLKAAEARLAANDAADALVQQSIADLGVAKR